MNVNEARSLRRGWWLMALGLLIGLAGAELITRTTPPIYRSSTQLFVAARGTVDPSAAYTGNLFTQQRVASYLHVVQDEQVSREVIEELGLPMTPDELTSVVTATALPETVIVEIAVTDTSAQRARDIAASFSGRFIEEVTALERSHPTAQPPVKVSVVEPADINLAPVSPDRARNAALGGLLGLLAGMALAVVRGRLDPTLQDTIDVEAATGAAALAIAPQDERLAQQSVADMLDPHGAGAEAFRLLRTRLLGSRGGDSPGVIVVSSAYRGEGRTTVAVQLAAAVARSRRTVLLVDADVHCPHLTRQLGLAASAGLTEALAGTVDLSTVVQEQAGGRPAFLPVGRSPADHEGALEGQLGAMPGTPQIRALLETLSKEFDCIVVDAPPLLTEGGAATLSAVGDGCLLVSRFGRTRGRRLKEAAQTLSWHGAALLGVVLNGAPDRAVARGRQYPPDEGRPTARGAAATSGSSGSEEQHPGKHRPPLVTGPADADDS